MGGIEEGVEVGEKGVADGHCSSGGGGYRCPYYEERKVLAAGP